MRAKPRTRCGSAQAGGWQLVYPVAWGLEDRARPPRWADWQAGAPGTESHVPPEPGGSA